MRLRSGSDYVYYIADTTNNDGSISGTLNDLSPATTYYYKAYAIYTSEGERREALGEKKSFTTLQAK